MPTGPSRQPETVAARRGAAWEPAGAGPRDRSAAATAARAARSAPAARSPRSPRPLSRLTRPACSSPAPGQRMRPSGGGAAGRRHPRRDGAERQAVPSGAAPRRWCGPCRRRGRVHDAPGVLGGRRRGGHRGGGTRLADPGRSVDRISPPSSTLGGNLLLRAPRSVRCEPRTARRCCWYTWSSDATVETRLAAAANGACPLPALARLAADPEPVVRATAASNRACPEQMLRRLGVDPHYGTRNAAAANPTMATISSNAPLTAPTRPAVQAQPATPAHRRN